MASKNINNDYFSLSEVGCSEGEQEKTSSALQDEMSMKRVPTTKKHIGLKWFGLAVVLALLTVGVRHYRAYEKKKETAERWRNYREIMKEQHRLQHQCDGDNCYADPFNYLDKIYK